MSLSLDASVNDLNKLKALEPVVTEILAASVGAMATPNLGKIERVVFTKFLEDGLLCALQIPDGPSHFRRIPQKSLDSLKKMLEGSEQNSLKEILTKIVRSWLRTTRALGIEKPQKKIKAGDIACLTKSLHLSFNGVSGTSQTQGPILGVKLFTRETFEKESQLPLSVRYKAKVLSAEKGTYHIPDSDLSKLVLNKRAIVRFTGKNPKFLRTLVGFQYDYYQIGDLFLPEELGLKVATLYLGKKLESGQSDEKKTT